VSVNGRSKKPYIGTPKFVKYLTEERGIVPELAPELPGRVVPQICSIGFCEKERKWYGWGCSIKRRGGGNRTLRGFRVGQVIKVGSIETQFAFPLREIEKEPALNRSVKPGFKIKTLEDARRAAIAYSDALRYRGWW